MYYYSLYGWNVESEFEFSELLKGDDKAPIDIKVLAKDVPKELKGAKQKGFGFQIKPNYYQLNIEGISRFYVVAGEEIWIDQEEGIDFKEVKVYLFASVLGGLCHLRNTLPIHAGSVAYNGNSYLFAGNSGVGKSTLVAGLQKSGLLALNDDLSPIMLESGKPFVKQGVARMKLWPDALSWLGENQNSENKIRADLEKYAHSIHPAYTQKAFPIKSLFILKPNIHKKALTISKITGKEKLVKLMRQTYRTQLIEGLGLKQQHFEYCSMLSSQIDIYEVEQPRNLEGSFDVQLDGILQSIKSN